VGVQEGLSDAVSMFQGLRKAASEREEPMSGKVQMLRFKLCVDWDEVVCRTAFASASVCACFCSCGHALVTLKHLVRWRMRPCS